MARRRLNKKVAFIGSGIFVVLVLIVIAVILYLSRDPQKFIDDGDAAINAAHQATDKQIKEDEYKKAGYCYGKAHSLAKTDSLKIDMLFKLTDLYIETDQWKKVLSAWNSIILTDNGNIKARFGRLKYIYIMADSSGGQLWQWQEVQSQASDFIKIAEENSLLAEDVQKWDYPQMPETGDACEHLGSYLYQRKGRAALEIAKLGAVTDPNALLDDAVADLEKAKELEPNNTSNYRYLAQAMVARGEILASKGDMEGRDENDKQAVKLLEQAVEISGGDVETHISLLVMKAMTVRGSIEEQVRQLEPEILSLVEKFKSDAQAFSALGGFYSRPILGQKYLDKAIEAAEKAVELDRENVVYALNAANVYYQRFSTHGQKQDINRAIELARNALTLPGTQDKHGPREVVNRMNRISLYLFLANCYIEQILDGKAATAEENKELLADAEEMVRNIEQSFGSGEDPYVIEWQGMLELAKGNRNAAVRKLYTAYEQIKASGMEGSSPSLLQRSYARLAYVLAKNFEGTDELGAVMFFFASALKAGIVDTKPQVILDYAEVLLKLNGFNVALDAVNFFENRYWVDERSKTLRARIYIAARQFSEAEEELAKRQPDDPNTIELNLALVESKIGQLQRVIEQKEMERGLGTVLRKVSEAEKGETDSQIAELKSYNLRRAELVDKLLEVEPDVVGQDSFAAVCDNYIAEGSIERARDLVNRFLGNFPADTKGLVYKQMLSEPEPEKISQQRRKEIEAQVLSGVADPAERSVKLALFYQANNEPNEAAEEFKKVLKIETLRDSGKPVFDLTGEITDSQRLAADRLFEIALGQKNWELADPLAEEARRKNIDDCEGRFFAARLAMAKSEYKKALTSIDECLKQRPVFSRAYVLRSNANAALGNELASIEDAKKALLLNSMDKDVTKRLAFVLCQRNEKLGSNVSSDQVIETEEALSRAVALNADDSELLGYYAEYIAAKWPLNGLAIRQKLQKTTPSMVNAMLLGKMATRLALRDENEQRRQALLDIAASAFEQARKIDPNDKTMLANYAEYLRISGQEEKATQLLEKSEDRKLLWAYYFQSGQFENAKKVLEQLYQTDSKDVNAVKGLLFVAQRTADEESVKKYSEELLLLQDTPENRLFQIQTFLETGLIKEAEHKLQSFKEKFPDEPRVLLLEAWLAMTEGQLKKALDLTNRNLETNQDNAVAWRLRGQINLLMANYDQAIIDLRKSKSLLDEPQIRLVLARAYQRAGRSEDAITELEGILDHPQAPPQVRLLLEQLYWQLGKKEALERFYDESLKKFPDNIEWYNRAASFAVAQGEVNRAELLYAQAWQKSKEQGTGDATSLEGYLWTLMAGGKMDKFFEEAGKYADGDFAPAVLVKIAEAKLRLNDREAALQYFRKAVDKAGTDENLVFNILQQMYTMLGSKEALAYCEEKLKTNPDSIAANMAMYNLKMINSQYNSAVEYIDKCLNIIGPNSPGKVTFIMKKAEVFTLAYSKTSDNNYLKKAITEYESLLAEMPNEPEVLNNLAYMLAEENTQLDKALEYSKQAHELKPNDPGFLDTYAYILYKNGKLSEATEFIQSALQQYEQNKVSAPADVYEHLGMIKEGQGLVDEAIAAYKQALDVKEGLTKVTAERIKATIERLSLQGSSK
jgi:tetratricopeptide (TPR) repeat protein